jgi:hypothetical protein
MASYATLCPGILEAWHAIIIVIKMTWKTTVNGVRTIWVIGAIWIPTIIGMMRLYYLIVVAIWIIWVQCWTMAFPTKNRGILSGCI